MPSETTPLSAALPGTWELLSRTDVNDAGELRDEPSLGSDPIALLISARSGVLRPQFLKRGRAATAGGDAATAGSNNTRTQGGYDAYFGTYAIDDATGTDTQRLGGALSAAGVGLEMPRQMQD